MKRQVVLCVFCPHPSNPHLLFYFHEFYHVSQAVSKLLGSGNSPASATQVPGVAGAQHNSWLIEGISKWWVPTS